MEANASVNLTTLLPWLPKGGVKGKVASTVTATVKLTDAKWEYISNTEATFQARLDDQTISNTLRTTLTACKEFLCGDGTASDHVFVRRALVATPTIIFTTDASNALQVDISAAEVASGNIKIETIDKTKTALTYTKPLVLAGELQPSNPELGNQCHRVMRVSGVMSVDSDYEGDFDDVVFEPGSSIRVLHGKRFHVHAERIQLPPQGATVDGTGDQGDPVGRGDACPNCCNGGCMNWEARTNKDYDGANGDCSRDVDHQDNGRTRGGSQGQPGATITIEGVLTGGALKCTCAGGPGGPGGIRGPGKVHHRPGGGDPWECPGDPHKNDVGRSGGTGTPGQCSCSGLKNSDWKVKTTAREMRSEFQEAMAAEPFKRDALDKISEKADSLLQVDPKNGHALYYKGEVKRVERDRDRFRENFNRYLDVESTLGEREPGGLDAEICYASTQGYCHQRTGWILHLLANDFYAEACEETSPKGERIELFQKALNDTHQVFKHFPSGFDAGKTTLSTHSLQKRLSSLIAAPGAKC